jgi:hypothetical protein
MEPLVRWIEETPRERIIERAALRISQGEVGYRDLMAGTFLAAIRNIKPRPVGFKFHAVMAIHSAHLIAQQCSLEHQLLPMYWALDNFKSAQEQDRREGDWTLGRVDEGHIPAPTQAASLFESAMNSWDPDKADTATASLCRSAGALEVMELFFKFAIRDQRNIGHKPIFAMQCWRTLNTIGWQHAEPVLRSLAFGLLDLQGDSHRAPAGPYQHNAELATRVREGWPVGTKDQSATVDFLNTLRAATAEEAGTAALDHLNRGIDPGSLWDAVLLAGSEMLMNAPGIIPLHAVTAANALHYIYFASGVATTRLLCLLQAASWMPLYRARLQKAPTLRIDTIEPIDLSKFDSANWREGMMEALASDRMRAARIVVAALRADSDPEPLFRAARGLIVRKGGDSHQYKYGAAAWEEALLATDPAWRAPLAAAITAYTPAPNDGDTAVFTRVQDCARKL